MLLFVQDVPATQLPDALHVWMLFPLQLTEPATQVPTQEQLTQVELEHGLPEFWKEPLA